MKVDYICKYLVFLTLVIASCGKPHVSVLSELIPSRENTEVRLGYGVDIITEEPLERCMDWDEGEYIREDAAAGAQAAEQSTRGLEIHVEQISSYKQYDEFSRQSVSANISAKFYSGGYNYDGNRSSKMQSDQVIVGMKAFADYGRSYLKNPRLKPEFQELLEKNPRVFYARCGTEYISGFNEGQGIYVLMSTTANLQESYRNVAQSLKAKMRAFGAKAELSASFENIATSLLKFGALKIDVSLMGGSSLGSLSVLLSNDVDVAQFKEKIAEIMGELQRSAAQRHIYISSVYPGISSREGKVLASIKRETLKELFADYRKLMDNLLRLRKIIHSSDTFELPTSGFSNICTKYPVQCKEYLLQLAEREKGLRGALDKVNELSDNCVAAEKPSECKTLSPQELNIDEMTLIDWPDQFKGFLYQQWLDTYKRELTK